MGVTLIHAQDCMNFFSRSLVRCQNKEGIQGAGSLFRAQLIVVFVVSGITCLIAGSHSASSMLIGGLVSATPNLYFASVLFRYHGAQASKKIVSSFYKGEAMKLLLTFGLFAVVFKYLNVVPLVFFAGFIVAQMMFWFAPLFIDHQQNRSERDRNGI